MVGDPLLSALSHRTFTSFSFSLATPCHILTTECFLPHVLPRSLSAGMDNNQSIYEAFSFCPPPAERW
jgi:hypothetical protein